MRKVTLLLWVVAALISANPGVAQDDLTKAGDCDPSVIVYSDDLPVPTLDPISEGITDSFTFSWSEVVGDFFEYRVLLTVKDDTNANDTIIEIIENYDASALIPDTLFDFRSSFFDPQYPQGFEGWVWVSVHTIECDEVSHDLLHSMPTNGVSYFSVYCDDVVPQLAGVIAEDDVVGTTGVSATTVSEVFFSGTFDSGDGPACGETYLPSPRYTLVLDELVGLEAPQIRFQYDTCDFSIPLTVVGDAGRKSLRAHVIDFVGHVSDTLSVALEFYDAVTVQTFPNPMNLREGNGATIQVLGQVPAGEPLRIFGSFGHLIKTLQPVESDEVMTRYVWDGTNGENQKVSTGVYLFVVAPELGDKVTGKIAVVK